MMRVELLQYKLHKEEFHENSGVLWGLYTERRRHSMDVQGNKSNSENYPLCSDHVWKCHNGRNVNVLFLILFLSMVGFGTWRKVTDDPSALL